MESLFGLGFTPAYWSAMVTFVYLYLLTFMTFITYIGDRMTLAFYTDLLQGRYSIGNYHIIKLPKCYLKPYGFG